MVLPCDIWTPGVARVMKLIGDCERLRVIAHILHVHPSVVSRLWGSYQETGEYTRRQSQGLSRVTTPRQDSVLVSPQSHE